jgi:hypothetical protein
LCTETAFVYLAIAVVVETIATDVTLHGSTSGVLIVAVERRTGAVPVYVDGTRGARIANRPIVRPLTPPQIPHRRGGLALSP